MSRLQIWADEKFNLRLSVLIDLQVLSQARLPLTRVLLTRGVSPTRKRHLTVQ